MPITIPVAVPTAKHMWDSNVYPDTDEEDNGLMARPGRSIKIRRRLGPNTVFSSAVGR
jgi:hypothetical protein